MLKGLIRQRDEINEMQCDFTSGRGTKYAFNCMFFFFVFCFFFFLFLFQIRHLLPNTDSIRISCLFFIYIYYNVLCIANRV